MRHKGYRIETRLEVLETPLASAYGGTVGSAMLREALQLKQENTDKTLAARIDAVIDVWRRVLVQHNAQFKKFIEYDVITGEPKND